ncbi:MAG: ComEC/Rec2 family competence protein [Clostridia bacterium]|nr:ComEC/Rec2 family competence protein [Clostridia bacterium]
MLRIRRPFIISFAGMMLSSVMLMTGSYCALWVLVPVLSGLFLFSAFRKAAICKAVLILLLCTLLSVTSFSLYDTVREKESSLAGYNKEISGTVTDISYDSRGNIQSALLSRCTADNRKIYSDIKIYTDKKAVFSYGDRLKITSDRLFAAEGEGIFRYHSLSDRCHLACTYKTENSTVTKGEQSLYKSILEIRSYSASKLRAALTEDACSVSQALFTGSRDNVSPELSAAFRICGISHIFAVSGMHLSLWTGMFFIIFRRRAKISAVPNILASFFVIFYTVFTGFSPSVLRAGIMLLTVFTGRLIRRKADALNSLGLAGTILTGLNPYLAGNVSFLLSFIATGAIAFWDEYILPEKKQFRGFFRKIKLRLMKPFYDTVTSLAVILTTLPVVSLFFGYASLLSPLASLIITPLAEAIMVLSFFIVILPSGNILHSAVRDFSEALCGSLTDTVLKLSEADFMLIPVKLSFLIPVFTITAVLCILFLIFFEEKKKAFICILAGTLIFTGLTGADIYTHRDETEITVFGKENATLISVSDCKGSCAVIGSGGSYSLISELSRSLNRKGITKTDLLLIPREKDTENGNTEYLQEALMPLSTVRTYEYSTPVSISLRDDCRIYSYTTESLSAVSLYVGETKIVICPYPSSVFGDAHREFLWGDILICRSNIPETLDTDAFADVIIVTDIYKEHLSSFISSIDRNITITVKGDSYALC